MNLNITIYFLSNHNNQFWIVSVNSLMFTQSAETEETQPEGAMQLLYRSSQQQSAVPNLITVYGLDDLFYWEGN